MRKLVIAAVLFSLFAAVGRRVVGTELEDDRRRGFVERGRSTRTFFKYEGEAVQLAGFDEQRGYFEPPRTPREWRWAMYSWSAPLFLLGVTGLALWQRRRARPSDRQLRQRIEQVSPTLAQLPVNTPSWPPDGELEVLPSESGEEAVRRARWPGATPLRLAADAELVAAQPAPGTWWILGARLGGDGGPREIAPRLEPVGGVYRASRRPWSWAELVAEARPPRVVEEGPRVRWGKRLVWLGALVAPALVEQRGLTVATIATIISGLALWAYGD